MEDFIKFECQLCKQWLWAGLIICDVKMCHECAEEYGFLKKIIFNYPDNKFEEKIKKLKQKIREKCIEEL